MREKGINVPPSCANRSAPKEGEGRQIIIPLRSNPEFVFGQGEVHGSLCDQEYPVSSNDLPSCWRAANATAGRLDNIK